MTRSPTKRRARPPKVLGLLAAAGALGGMVLAGWPQAPEPFGNGPLGALPALPGGSVVPGRFPMSAIVSWQPGRPIDRCLVPAPRIDDRFIVSAPDTGDRPPLTPLVTGMPVKP